MVILPIILFHLFISEISAYSIAPIQGIKNEFIINVGFDGKGNTYVVATSSGGYRFYKLNPSNEISSAIDLPDNASEMLVSSRGDAYFYFSNYNRTIATVRADSKEIEIIDQITNKLHLDLFYLDNDDNFFYSKEKGIYVIRPNSTTPVSITNLEDFTSTLENVAVADKSGNIYLAVENKQNYSIALITKDALQEEKPYTTFINDPQLSTLLASEFTIDEQNNLWMALNGFNQGVIKKLEGANFKTVLTDTTWTYFNTVQGKEKTFLIATQPDSFTVSLHYVTPNGDVVEVPEMKNFTSKYAEIHGVADSEGNVYLNTFFDLAPSSSAKMIAINSDEMKPIPITFQNNSGWKTELKIKLDFNDDLWIINSGSEIYYMKKGELSPELVNNPKEECSNVQDISANFITKKMYVSCATGLFIVVESI